MSLPLATTSTVRPDAASMRAVTQQAYGSVKVLDCRTVPCPTAGPGEVLVRVHAAGLDRGTWHLMTGLPRLVRLAMGLRRPRQPIVGRDLCGTVVDVGDEVTTVEVGQRVFGATSGSMAEFAVAKATKLAVAPQRATDEQAAVLGISGLTALQALDAARVDRGSRVLVIGASGGVGSYAVKIAASRGAVVTAACSARKAEQVRAWGAQRVLDYARDDLAVGDEQYDVIIDIAGGTSLRRLRRMLSAVGTIVYVGNETGGTWTGGLGRPMRNTLRMLMSKQRYVMLMAREAAPEDLQQLAALVDDGALDPHVHAVYRMDDVRAAMTALIDGEVCGKVAIRVAPSAAPSGS